MTSNDVGAVANGNLLESEYRSTGSDSLTPIADLVDDLLRQDASAAEIVAEVTEMELRATVALLQRRIVDLQASADAAAEWFDGRRQRDRRRKRNKRQQVRELKLVSGGSPQPAR